MLSDRQLRSHVEEQLDWEPTVTATHIGVAVEGGVVTLSGHVPTWTEKWNAERAVRRLAKVRGLANEIEVILPSSHERSDTEIAKAAVQALRWRTLLPNERIKVTVKDGCLALDGEVDANYQRQGAEDAVRHLLGVRRVTNNIDVIPSATPSMVKEKIKQTLERYARLDAEGIQVDIADGKVTLRGKVPSMVEKDEAEDAAWAAPGVRQVDNQLRVFY